VISALPGDDDGVRGNEKSGREINDIDNDDDEEEEEENINESTYWGTIIV